jgi:hypothetical protein
MFTLTIQGNCSEPGEEVEVEICRGSHRYLKFRLDTLCCVLRLQLAERRRLGLWETSAVDEAPLFHTIFP